MTVDSLLYGGAEQPLAVGQVGGGAGPVPERRQLELAEIVQLIATRLNTLDFLVEDLLQLTAEVRAGEEARLRAKQVQLGV